MLHKIIDYIFIVILIGSSIFVYHQYIEYSKKVYSVDMTKIFKLKNEKLKELKDNGTKADYDKYFSTYKQMIIYTDRYLKNISSQKNTIIYTKQAFFGRSIDLTPRLIVQLKNRSLL